MRYPLPGKELGPFGDQEGMAVHAVEMPRRITPLNDLVALWRLFHLLRRIRPHLVHAHTPKAGLLGTIAAWLARVPIRIYHIHGLPHMTAKGPSAGSCSGPRERLARWPTEFSVSAIRIVRLWWRSESVRPGRSKCYLPVASTASIRRVNSIPP